MSDEGALWGWSVDQRTAISTVLQMSGGHVGCRSFQCAVLKVLFGTDRKVMWRWSSFYRYPQWKECQFWDLVFYKQMPVIRVNNCLLLINYAFKILPVCCMTVGLFWADNTRPHSSISPVMPVYQHTSLYIIHNIYKFFDLSFSAKGDNWWVLFVHTFSRNPTEWSPLIQTCRIQQRWTRSCCCHVLSYVLASKSDLMSLMPSSAAMLMMWSKAFTWPSIFTTSLTWSLLADMEYIRNSMDKNPWHHNKL